MSELNEIMEFHDEISDKLNTIRKQITTGHTKKVLSIRREADKAQGITSDKTITVKADGLFETSSVTEKELSVSDNILSNIKCPSCNGAINIGESITNTEHVPSGGDMTVCAHCAEIAVFTDELTLRKPTAVELLDLANDEESAKQLIAVQNGIRKKFKKQ